MSGVTLEVGAKALPEDALPPSFVYLSKINGM